MKKTILIATIVAPLVGASTAAQGAQGAPGQTELIPRCVPNVLDEATGNCLTASSMPELGKLYPLGPELWISANGRVEVGGSLEAQDDLIADRVLGGLVFGNSVESVDLKASSSLVVGLEAGLADLEVRKSDSAELLLEADLFNLDEFWQPKITFVQDGGGVVSTIGFMNGGNELQFTNEFDADQLFNLPTGGADWEFWKRGATDDRKAFVNQVGNLAIDGNFFSGGADVAEYYPVRGAVEPGDVVAFTGEGLDIERAVAGAGGRLAGIVSTDPGVVLGLTYTDEAETGENPEDVCGDDRLAAIRHEIQVNRRAPLALTGRVPCKVSAENGAIQTGDLLTVATLPGYAAKATRSGAVIGTALEGWSAGEGTILVLANRGWFTPDLSEENARLRARLEALERRVDALARK